MLLGLSPLQTHRLSATAHSVCPNNLLDEITVGFVDVKEPTKGMLKNALHCRRHIIAHFFMFLKENHPLYRDFEMDSEALARLAAYPEDARSLKAALRNLDTKKDNPDLILYCSSEAENEYYNPNLFRFDTIAEKLASFSEELIDSVANHLEWEDKYTDYIQNRHEVLTVLKEVNSIAANTGLAGI
ncbi:hypothetical protein BT69DRAFT_1295478 [Atractiella rhizophila]|nr:hypothetical protein BT69DRAFT_1295478 [Atractiella rhizophila]